MNVTKLSLKSLESGAEFGLHSSAVKMDGGEMKQTREMRALAFEPAEAFIGRLDREIRCHSQMTYLSTLRYA
jgi:hypothetical protein